MQKEVPVRVREMSDRVKVGVEWTRQAVLRGEPQSVHEQRSSSTPGHTIS